MQRILIKLGSTHQGSICHIHSVKKLSFYLDSVQITLRSNHLPLKKFLEKNTMNAKVNNWAVELESQNINFEFIAGTKNVLADTLSRLIEFDDSIKLPE